MRALFTFIGGVGHFEPMAPLARAMQAAGHEVAVAGSGARVAQVAAAGFHALATSPIRQPEPAERDLTPLEPVDAYVAEVEFATNFADKGARRHATAIGAHIQEWRPDLVVRDEADLGSAIAAEVSGVPTATVLVLASGMLIRPELVGPPLMELRAAHGLRPDPSLAMLTRGLVVSPFPRSFRSPDSPVPLPDDTVFFSSGTPVPSRRGLPSHQRVYVTLGTVFNTGSGDLFERLLAGVAEIEAEVLVTVGRDLDPSGFGPQPSHVTVERFRPQTSVLRACDLVVSHGGSGSLGAALAHGIPSVLLPLGADQPHNAQRAETLGLARALDAATVPPEDIRRCIEDALGDDEMRARARAVADEMAAQPSAEDVVPLLEERAAVGD